MTTNTPAPVTPARAAARLAQWRAVSHMRRCERGPSCRTCRDVELDASAAYARAEGGGR